MVIIYQIRALYDPQAKLENHASFFDVNAKSINEKSLNDLLCKSG